MLEKPLWFSKHDPRLTFNLHNNLSDLRAPPCWPCKPRPPPPLPSPATAAPQLSLCAPPVWFLGKPVPVGPHSSTLSKQQLLCWFNLIQCCLEQLKPGGGGGVCPHLCQCRDLKCFLAAFTSFFLIQTSSWTGLGKCREEDGKIKGTASASSSATWNSVGLGSGHWPGMETLAFTSGVAGNLLGELESGISHFPSLGCSFPLGRQVRL